MRYAILIYENAGSFEERKSPGTSPYIAAWRAYHRSLVESGAYVGGEPLEPVSSATTVRIRSGARHVQDGPYADSKEQLGGFIILDLPSLDAALDSAARCPAAATGVIEVRPLSTGTRESVVGPGGDETRERSS